MRIPATSRLLINCLISTNFKPYALLVFSFFISLDCMGQAPIYAAPDQPWPESFGNHRAVVQVEAKAEAVRIEIPWRRHDPNPQFRMLLLVSDETGDTVLNLSRIRVDNEWCEIIAGPVKAGVYYLYYLPFEVQEGYGFYNRDYLPAEAEAVPDTSWLESLNRDATPNTILQELQARTPFDSFFPMEVIPFKSEKNAFLRDVTDPFLLFTEDRRFPIRMLDEVPLKWIQDPHLNHFDGEALVNEFYTFQVGLYAVSLDLKNIEVEFFPLEGPEDAFISADRLTCFNTEGVDTYGKPFQKEVDVKMGAVQPLWIGIDIPRDVAPGSYKGKIGIGPTGHKKHEVSVELKIDPELLSDRGDSEAWRHSRLRWLNSTLGIDPAPVAPYGPIGHSDPKVYNLTGKQIIAAESGFPQSIRIGHTEVLERPIAFNAVGRQGAEVFSPALYQPAVNDGGILKSSWTSNSKRVSLSVDETIESDGYLNYMVSLKALKNINLEDIQLEIPFRKEVARYMMGMGLPGATVPDQHDTTWHGPEDSFWIGNTRGGLWVELRGSTYHGPLLNLYHPAPPESWSNHGKGGFRIENRDTELVAKVYSGERKLKKGEKVEFEFALLMTPVKDINPKSQFRDRYYHNSSEPDPGPEDLDAGVRIVNLHHANPYNPIINYPFAAVDVMKPFVERNQAKGLKVKIYYTIRELTNHLPELWALRSLQGEIFDYGRGRGYPWLREHLVKGYRPQWYDHSDDTRVDASLLTAPGDSRWINYYIEGLGWLVRNVGIDGLYLDDVSFDRHIMKRIRKVLDEEKPGSLIDLHSNTGFSKGPATQYAEFFPYVDKLWFGESFLYDEMSAENWLVEVSGIPFGLMGDMLHGGGNPWLGMVFGMTTRLPWSTEGVLCNPVAIWNIWDEFGIEESSMQGFWEEEPVITTDHPHVKATAYVREGKVLLSLGNFSDEAHEVKLRIDWNRLDFGPEQIRCIAPEIDNFQEYGEWELDKKIRVEPRRGCLLYMEPR
jgi:hypothetical protein